MDSSSSSARPAASAPWSDEAYMDQILKKTPASAPWSEAHIDEILKNPPLDEAAIDLFLEPVRSGKYPDWSKLTDEQGFYVMTTRGDELDPDAYTAAPRKYWDPEDSSTWKKFGDLKCRRTKFLLSPSIPSIKPDFEITGTFVFELYFIEIVKLDPRTDFKTITISCRATSYTPLLIYKRPDGQEEIDPYTILPLKIPIGPTVAGNLNGVIFQIFDCMDFYYQDHPYGVKPNCDKPLLKLVKQEGTQSAANLCYEFITSAAKAHLVFCFLRDQSPIHIVSGKIYAFNGEDFIYTKRIIKSFSSDDHPVLITDDKELKVDRFVFGVPTTSTLTVSVELTYYNHEGYEGIIRESSTFSVPKFWHPKKHIFTGTDGTRLALTVHWSNV